MLQWQKGRHTLKVQVLLDWEPLQALQVIATAFSKGRVHDFKLFKHSSNHVHLGTMVLADLGYLGLERLHAHSFPPANVTKHHPLTYEEKRANRTLARLRLHIEQVIGKLKVFRILAEHYRGRREPFGLRFDLIAGIYNFELALSS